jgi:hypothetical protein
MLAGRPLSVPRARRYRHHALAGNGEGGTATGAPPGINKPLRAISSIGVEDYPTLAALQGNDVAQKPAT